MYTASGSPVGLTRSVHRPAAPLALVRGESVSEKSWDGGEDGWLASAQGARTRRHSMPRNQDFALGMVCALLGVAGLVYSVVGPADIMLGGKLVGIESVRIVSLIMTIMGGLGIASGLGQK